MKFLIVYTKSTFVYFLYVEPPSQLRCTDHFLTRSLDWVLKRYLTIDETKFKKPLNKIKIIIHYSECLSKYATVIYGILLLQILSEWRSLEVSRLVHIDFFIDLYIIPLSFLCNFTTVFTPFFVVCKFNSFKFYLVEKMTHLPSRDSQSFLPTNRDGHQTLNLRKVLLNSDLY